MVDKPTRGAKILDLILTNMHKFYDVQPAIVFPPFGLSDHNVIMVEPKVKTSSEIPSRKTVIKRDIRQSRKKELGRYLSNFDWQMIDSSEPCDKNCDILCSAIKTGYDILMPEKHVKFHRNDNPWITEKLKQLIKFRQRAFSSNNTTLFKFYRNKVNRMRKSCRADYFASKVANLKKSNPKSCWTEVKRISGMRPVSGSLLNQLHVEDTEHLTHKGFADLINKSLIEPMNTYDPLNVTDLNTLLEEIPDYPLDVNMNLTNTASVLKKLKSLNPHKAPGPDDIPNWILRDYAEILAPSVSDLLNSSYKQKRLPSCWKQANITPIPKEKPVKDISKQLRPISLTPVLSKLAEEFVVEKYIAPAVLSSIDPFQFGGIPRSSATKALIYMVHAWTEATDGTGNAVRVVLFDYKKAFDLIDHKILATKIIQLPMPTFIKRWVIDFLMNRQQREKLARDCMSEWIDIPSGVPQGTKLGPWLFILLINDLLPAHHERWKYIDDATVSEIIHINTPSKIQDTVDCVQNWSVENKMQLNASKCKELVISFTKPKKEFPRLKIISGQSETVNHARILGLTISKDLKWNQHITNIVKKANKRIYFIIQLKRAHVPEADIIKFYTTCVRPVMEFSCQVFHFALPSYLSNALERVQKRVLSIIYPLTGYADCLQKSGIKPLSDRRVDACEKLFNEITTTPAANMHNHIPSRYFPNYDLRHSRSFVVPQTKTNRFRNSFFPSCARHINNIN